MNREYSQKWNLDVFFKGGSGSPEFIAFLDNLSEDVRILANRIETMVEELNQQTIHQVVNEMQEIEGRFQEASAFIGCLEAQDVDDKQAGVLQGRISQLFADYESTLTLFDQKLTQIGDQRFNEYLRSPDISPISFAIAERRQRALLKLPAALEGLVNALAVDGYHGWEDLYSTIVDQIHLAVEIDGETKKLSVGQASNLLSSADRSLRSRVFQQLTNAWGDQGELCASALNHLAGFRLNLYKKRGWSSVLQEPLFLNRMSEPTLNSMWAAIEYAKPKLVEYLKRKAKLLGVDKLSWYDLEAPLGTDCQSIAYGDASEFIIQRFNQFSSDMAKFAKMALENEWIEAEDRPGKRPGGFCTEFSQSKQSRIFMTYSGTNQGVSTLAHELGHAYHAYVVQDMPVFARDYSMNVAETASTFAELVVANAAIQQTTDEAERLGLLDDKIQSSVAFFMNIHARFLFEVRFYQARSQGQLTVEELNELMTLAQKDAYGDALDQYHPQFWASKLHFYITDVPFYNFPYTFGYLFSTGVYAQALVEGEDFAKRYRDLLQDTGRMRVEDLAHKHLGVDLAGEDFWQAAVNLVMQDVDEFLAITAEQVTLD